MTVMNEDQKCRMYTLDFPVSANNSRVYCTYDFLRYCTYDYIALTWRIM